MPDLLEAAETLHKAVLDFRLAMGLDNRRAAWAEIADKPEVQDAVANLGFCLEALAVALEPAAERGKALDNVCKRAENMVKTLQAFLSPDDSAESVQWYETYSQSFILRVTPLDVARQFRGHMSRRPAAWIFTSATLSVGNQFDHFRRRLGLPDDMRTLQVDSPFDYRRNALLYLPLGLPQPNSERYDAEFLKAALPVLEASRGRAFILFTSHRALRFAADWLASRIDHPLLVQGEASQAQLLERFRELGNAVLLGTSSFWEGVDVRGEALSAVLIDRLPFASPSDPVMQAKIEALNRRNGNPFVHHQLPLAVIALRQGVGRLIRDVDDRGVLMIGDNRLLTKSYGRVFLQSLPAIPITRELEDVRRFFAPPASAAS